MEIPLFIINKKTTRNLPDDDTTNYQNNTVKPNLSFWIDFNVLLMFWWLGTQTTKDKTPSE